MTMQGIKAINWLLYKQYCKQNNLSQCQLKNLNKYMKERGF